MEEVETKLEADDGFVVPPLDGLGGVAYDVERRAPAVLDATYWDTPDRALLSAGVTLRHRAEPGFTGWQLKLPKGMEGSAVRRSELPFEGGSDVVPRAVVEQLGALVDVAALGPVARVRTERTDVVLTPADGAGALVVSDDAVTGHDLGAGAGAEPVRFREVEVEGPPGPLADAVVAALRAAGARDGGGVVKVARVLGRG